MAYSGSVTLPSKPMSVEQIVRLATEPYFDSSYSLRQWLRTANLMQKNARIYESEGVDLQLAYFLYYRHADLVLNQVLTHAEARSAGSKQCLADARKDVAQNLARLEVLKPKINARFQRYQQTLRERHIGASSAQQQQQSHGLRSVTPEAIDVDDNPDQAVQWANEELMRRARITSDQEIFAGMRLARHAIDASQAQRRSQISEPDRTEMLTKAPRYPRVDKPTLTAATALRHSPLPHIANQPLPVVPPKRRLSDAPLNDLETSTDTIRESYQPIEALEKFAAAAYLENGTPLRTIFLPSTLRHDFVRIAKANTARNLETCGMLCGTMIRNALFVSKLVIPEQIATSDTCEMINEELLLEYIESHSGTQQLMQLGWIHTHPTQSCFLSSRDLHTHVGYQSSLAESIAIVCAPSRSAPEDYGVFRLTDPSGMQVLRTCKQPGNFHPHETVTGGLYTDSLGRPGHVREHSQLKYEIVDLRS